MKPYKVYQYQTIFTSSGEIANGTYIIDEMIIRTKDGLLNNAVGEYGETLPAIEKLDGTHSEHWKNGVLHRDDDAAVIDVIDNYCQWWKNGKLVKEDTLVKGVTK